MDRSRYDYDPEALAWARAKVQAYSEKNRCSSCAVISRLNRGYAVRSIEVTSPAPAPDDKPNITPTRQSRTGDGLWPQDTKIIPWPLLGLPRRSPYIDRLASFEQQAKTKNDAATALGCGVSRLLAERHFLGDGGCTIGAFDERLPNYAKAIDNALPAPVDRAVKRDHSLCGVSPCTDCR